MARNQGNRARESDDEERAQADEATNGQETNADSDGAGGSDVTVTNELKQIVRQAAIDVLGPAAKQATTSAAKYAVKKGPELMSNNVMPAVAKQGGPGGLLSKGGEALSEAGGVGGVAGKLMSKLGGGGAGGGGDASGWGRNRRMPVQQWTYVSVSARRAYNGWTEYKQWPRYMHRANQVDPQIDDKSARLKVTEKMWGFTRPFTAEMIAQRPDEHIKWQSTDGTKQTGVVNFHELGPRLTLVEVNIDHAPSGMVEKLARGARFDKRAVRADLHRFKGWIEMKSDEELDELEGWRGTIEDGQIVKSHEDAVSEEDGRQDGAQDRERDEPEGEYEDEPDADRDEEPEEDRDEESEEDRDEDEEEPEGEYDEEPEDAAEAEPEDEAEDDDEEDEDEEPPRRQRSTQRRRPASRRPQKARR